MTKLFYACVVAFGLATVMLAANAHGETAHAEVSGTSVAVTYADLDITRGAGANALYGRIKAASVRACGGAPDVRLIAQGAIFDQCRKVSIRRAIVEIGSPLLASR